MPDENLSAQVRQLLKVWEDAKATQFQNVSIVFHAKNSEDKSFFDVLDSVLESVTVEFEQGRALVALK